MFVNGFHVKTQRFGYIGFSVDITEALYFGKKNVIAVRVDSEEGAEGWWYEGAGIYRHVWLEKCSPVHIPSYGVALNPQLNNSFSKGALEAKIEVVNESDNTRKVSPKITLVDAKGKVVGVATSAEKVIEPGQRLFLEAQLEISNPKLWSPSNPNLYSVETSLIQDGKVVDGLKSSIGFRKFTFDTKQGFLVNGKKVIIKGMSMHQDHAGVGVAVPDSLLKYRLEKLKEMGVNAYRSHHPNAPELTQMCNEMGILLLAETRHFSCFSESADMLERMVKMERNHPSVMAWCLGNEEKIQHEPRAATVVKKMRRMVNQLDPQKRPVTIAFNNATNGPVAHEVDVVGYNYGTQRIRGEIKHNNPMYSSESGSVVCTRGEYETDKKRGIVSCYDRKAVAWGQSAEDVMDFTMTMPKVGGTFYWTGFDYRGEPTPYGKPNVVSNFGLLDLCGFRKDLSYYFEAWWSDREVLHIFPHWNWKGAKKEKINIWVYSNHDEVELFLNNKSLGRKKMPKYKHLEWDVPFTAGNLSAKGYRNGKATKQTVVRTAGEASQIKVTADRSHIKADEQDVVVFNIEILDKNGVVCPRANNILKFEVSGAGRMLGSGNGNPRSHESDKLPMRKAYNGLMQVIVQSTTKPGDIVFKVTGKGLKSANVNVKSIESEQLFKRVPSDVKEVELMKFYPESTVKGKQTKKGDDWDLEQMYQDTAGYTMDN